MPLLPFPANALEAVFSNTTDNGAVLLAAEGHVALVMIEPGEDPAVSRAGADLNEDFVRVVGKREPAETAPAGLQNTRIIAGTLGRSKLIDHLAAEKKLDTAGIAGQWESYVLQIVKQPMPGVEQALVIAGSDRRGTVYGIYQLSEMMGVSPWYWWADVPVAHQDAVAMRGGVLKQGPPAVKYRGIFLNDEDWGLRMWASKTFDPSGRIGPKTYEKIFELLLRLRANYLWPAMHPGTTAFNQFPENAPLAEKYGIVMGASHCEQMLRNNISEWQEEPFGEYNYVTNPEGVRKYWEQRVRENGRYENVYTLGMRGIHDSGMPGGGTAPEKAARLQTIVGDQREMLRRWVNTNVAEVPQIFCPYKEVLPLYRLMTNLPEDVTLVWPDDNFGYVRQFSNARERQRSGGAGVYYHVSYYGAPRDYLWLCSTPPALIAEEMAKAFDYGADKVWIVNVGDLKPAELDMEFFLKLGWNPPAWKGTNTYDLFQPQLARDFGSGAAPELTSVMAEYYRLNFQRKPEHVGFPTNGIFPPDEAAQRVAEWRALAKRVEAVEQNISPEKRGAFFELIGYPVKAAAAMNEKYLAGSERAAQEVRRLTDVYNHQTGGKWNGMMSDNPRNQLNMGVPKGLAELKVGKPSEAAFENIPGADFLERDHHIIMEAEHASAFVPGADARWSLITGLGYNGEAVTVFPTTVAVRGTPEKITAESPCLQFKIGLQTAGEWKFVVRALPTFSVDTGRPQRYAIALDDEKPQIVSLPLSQDERNRGWQENVLRNAALGSSRHAVAAGGAHTLKIWMVDPGIVIDAVAGEFGERKPGYLWPAETRAPH